MHKPNKDFKLSKQTKRILALMDGEKRGHWKKMMKVCNKAAQLKTYKSGGGSNPNQYTQVLDGLFTDYQTVI